MQQIDNVEARALVGTLAMTPRTIAGRDTWPHILGHVETSILVKTLALKLEVVAEALIQTVLHTLADVEGATLQDTQGGV